MKNVLIYISFEFIFSAVTSNFNWQFYIKIKFLVSNDSWNYTVLNNIFICNDKQNAFAYLVR